MAERSAGRPEIYAALREEIRASGPVPFARFMDLALHHPEWGYYAAGAERLGRGGDFFTASDVGPAFGATLARQIAEIDDRLGRPDPFRYVELGAGRGLLARDVLDALAPEGPRIAATLVERSPGMRRAAAKTVPEAEVVAPEAMRPGGDGCVVAVELFDALPVRRIVRRGAALHEIAVGCEGDRLVEVERPAGAAAQAFAERYGAAPADGDEAEVPDDLDGAVAPLARAVDRGVAVVVDYGDEAPRLYAPARRRGTLLAYHRHEVSEDYLARAGEQDLTAHVNFTALADAAAAAGLALVGITTQDRFLIANGILDGLDGAGDGLAAVKRRLQAKQLVHPGGMGRIFKVALFAKGIDPPRDLAGLADPFLGGPGGRTV